MKTQYKGKIELLNQTTGEVINCDVINKSNDSLDSKGWRRVIMADLMAAMDQIGNKKMKVLEYLIENMDSKNQVNVNYKKICNETNISYLIVVQTFKALKQANLIKKYGGVYVINCSIISSYGSSMQNGYLMLEYGFNGDSIIKNTSNNISNEDILKNEIDELKKQIELLKSNI